jgi:hypothetical protein
VNYGKTKIRISYLGDVVAHRYVAGDGDMSVEAIYRLIAGAECEFKSNCKLFRKAHEDKDLEKAAYHLRLARDAEIRRKAYREVLEIVTGG